MNCTGELDNDAARLLPFRHLVDQAHNFAWLDVPLGLQLGVNELAVHCHLETPAVGGDHGEAVDHMLELLKQFTCQAHGPVCVVSDSAVDNFDLQHEPSRR